MLDFDRMNKLQRILSAKTGTQIPKLLNAALPLQLNYDSTEAIRIFESGDRNGLRKYLLDRNIEIPNSIQSFIQGSDINIEEGHLELNNISKNVAKTVGSSAIVEKPKPSPEPAKPYTTNIQDQVISNIENPGLYINHNGGDVSKTVATNTKEVNNTPSIYDNTQKQISFVNQNPEIEAKDKLETTIQENNGATEQAIIDFNSSNAGGTGTGSNVGSGLTGSKASRALSGINLKSVNPFSKKNWSKEGTFGKAFDKASKALSDPNTLAALSGALRIGDGIATYLHDGSNERAEGTQITNMTNSAIDMAGSELSKVNPMVGAIVLNAQMFGNIASEIGGTQTDKMTTVDSIMDSGLMLATGLGFANGALGKKSDSFAADKSLLEQVGGSYGGSSSTILDALDKAGKKYGWFSNSARKKANAQIAEAKRLQDVLGTVNQNAQDRLSSASSNHELNYLAYGLNLAGGYDLRYNRAAKHGMKFEPIIGKVKEFKNGGKTPDFEDVIKVDTNQKSVIPEGALHKNKHHLKDVGLDDKELTKKGIPVVDIDGEQLAEIELNEIIFTLEVTKEIEKRYKEFYEEGTSNNRKDELAIEAGKLLWKEIIYNTDDRTGLIDTLKKGGVLKAKEGVVVPNLSEDLESQLMFAKFTPVIISDVESKIPLPSLNLSQSIDPTAIQQIISSVNQLNTIQLQTQLPQLTQVQLNVESENTNLPKDTENTPKGGRTADWFEPDPEVVRKVVEASNTTTIDAGKHGTVPMRPMDKGYGWCTAGPHTFYNRGIGVKLNGHWWVDANGKQITASNRVVDTGIGKVGFKKVWHGDEADTKTADFKAAIRPGDVVTSYGGSVCHAAMCCGIDSNGNPIMKADAPNSRVWVFRSGTGRRGKESVQIWRYAGKSVDKKAIGGTMFAKFKPVIVSDVNVPMPSLSNLVSPSFSSFMPHLSVFSPNMVNYSNNNSNVQNIPQTILNEQIPLENLENSINKTKTENNVILINKTNRTLTVNGKTFKVSISKKGTGQTTKRGDNLTPEGVFGLGNRKSMTKGYNDDVYGFRPNAYGGRFYALTGGIANGRGFGIHGSDLYNDPDRYEVGKFGTHGCIAMKNSDLDELEQIFQANGGPSNFKVKIVKAEKGGIISSKNQEGITQESIDLMVKQALLNILTQ